MKLAQLLIWLLISTSLLTLGHWYLYRRLIVGAELPQRWRQALGVLLVVLLVTQPLAFAFSRSLPRDQLSPYAFAVFLWMGLFSTMFSLLGVFDVGRFVVAILRKFSRAAVVIDHVPDPDRRRTFGRLLASGVALGGAGIVGAGASNALSHFRVVPLDVRLAKLPRAFDGFRIVQVSDIHIGPTIGHDFIQRMVETANGVGGDLIAITGDLVDGSVDQLAHHAAPLSGLAAPHGVFFVTGNHEYYSGADDWVQELQRLGIPTLRNRRVSIERGGAAFDLAGVTDHRAGQYDDAPDLEGALRGRDVTRELVLLAHQPAAVHEAARHDVGLQLSGHTHGGQFWPWNWAVYLVQPIVRGLGRFGRTQVYVNTGTGYWGPPVRNGSEPEITVVTLRCAAPDPARS